MLTHPLLVEAIEDQFVPVLIRNNVGGHEAKLLKQFKEPAWNYQVIRYLDSDLKDVIPRKDKIWTTGGTAIRMTEALKASEKPVPAYLQRLAWANSSQLEEAVFAMHCFWTGELRLGALEGVAATEAGWFDGREVVRVLYDPNLIGLKDLLTTASELQCASAVYLAKAGDRKVAEAARLRVGTFSPKTYRRAKESDQKRQLSGTKFARLKLSLEQGTKVNAFARTDTKKAASFLSPRQLKELTN